MNLFHQSREEWLTAKKSAIKKLQRRMLVLRIRVACGGLHPFELIAIFTEGALLQTQIHQIAATPFPGKQRTAAPISLNLAGTK